VLGLCDLPVLEKLNHMWATKLDATIDPKYVRWRKNNRRASEGKRQERRGERPW
jgi:hypothetical protein